MGGLQGGQARGREEEQEVACARLLQGHHPSSAPLQEAGRVHEVHEPDDWAAVRIYGLIPWGWALLARVVCLGHFLMPSVGRQLALVRCAGEITNPASNQLAGSLPPG